MFSKNHARKFACKRLLLHFSAKYVKAFSGRDQYLAEELSSQLAALSCGGKGVDMDLVWNSQTSPEACLGACGVVLELAEKVAKGELSNAFALIRPPGHLAENSQPLFVYHFIPFQNLGNFCSSNFCFVETVNRKIINRELYV